MRCARRQFEGRGKIRAVAHHRVKLAVIAAGFGPIRQVGEQRAIESAACQVSRLLVRVHAGEVRDQAESLPLDQLSNARGRWFFAVIDSQARIHASRFSRPIQKSKRPRSPPYNATPGRE
jgi:hypothetical protein